MKKNKFVAATILNLFLSIGMSGEMQAASWWDNIPSFQGLFSYLSQRGSEIVSNTYTSVAFLIDEQPGLAKIAAATLVGAGIMMAYKYKTSEFKKKEESKVQSEKSNIEQYTRDILRLLIREIVKVPKPAIPQTPFAMQ